MSTGQGDMRAHLCLPMIKWCGFLGKSKRTNSFEKYDGISGGRPGELPRSGGTLSRSGGLGVCIGYSEIVEVCELSIMVKDQKLY